MIEISSGFIEWYLIDDCNLSYWKKLYKQEEEEEDKEEEE